MLKINVHRSPIRWAGWVLTGWLLAGSGLLAAQTAENIKGAASPALRARVQQIVAQHHGKVALFAENLKTGQTIGLDADTAVQTASVIKLTILFDAMEQVRARTVQLSDPIMLRKDDQVGGSGVLQFFDTPLRLTLHDVLMLMITQSDNTAANLAIDKLGLDNIDAEIQRLGLKDTWLYKKISKPATEPMPADQKKFGLGKTTPREMASVLARMYHCQFTEPAHTTATEDQALCTDMLKLLREQFFRDGLPRLLEREDSTEVDASLGNKTGSLNAVRNDVGLVSTKAGPVILSIFTYDNADQGWSSDNEAEITIAKLSEAIVTAWSPQGVDPAGYRVHPEPLVNPGSSPGDAGKP